MQSNHIDSSFFDVFYVHVVLLSAMKQRQIYGCLTQAAAARLV